MIMWIVFGTRYFFRVAPAIIIHEMGVGRDEMGVEM